MYDGTHIRCGSGTFECCQLFPHRSDTAASRSLLIWISAMLIFWKRRQLTILLLVPVCVSSLMMLLSAQKAVGEKVEFATCHQEHSQDTSPVNQGSSKANFKVGDVNIIECNATGETWGFNHNNEPSTSAFLVYPHPKRTCVRNGLWSGPLPICVNTESDMYGAARQVELQQVRNCKIETSKECSSLEAWEPIGEFHGRCDGFVEKPTTVTSFEVILSFGRPYFLSFFTFPINGFYDVQLFARKKSIIRGISPEAQKFLSNHYSYWETTVIPVNQESKCPLINIAVFTDSVRLHFSVEAEGGNKEPPSLMSTIASFRFYRILKCYESEASEQKCLKEPIIPNGSKKRSDNNSLTFMCDPGFVMVDPESDIPSNGIINCIEGDWIPYPYPACASTSYGENSLVTAVLTSLLTICLIIIVIGGGYVVYKKLRATQRTESTSNVPANTREMTPLTNGSASNTQPS